MKNLFSIVWTVNILRGRRLYSVCMRSRPLASLLTLGVLALSAGPAIAWTGPTASPPNNNTSAPLNVGGAEQTKSGSLNLGGFLTATNYAIIKASGANNGWIRLDGANGTNVHFHNSGGYFQITNSPWNFEMFGVDQSGRVYAPQLCLSGVCKAAWPAETTGNRFGGMFSKYQDSLCRDKNGNPSPASTPSPTTARALPGLRM